MQVVGFIYSLLESAARDRITTSRQDPVNMFLIAV